MPAERVPGKPTTRRWPASRMCLIVDAFSRMIVGWRVAAHMRTSRGWSYGSVVALVVRLAGRSGLEVDGVAVADAGLGQLGRVALAFLVTERRRPVHRYELAEVLWDERLPATWESALRTHLTKLRAVLRRGGLPDGVLVARRGCYQLRLPDDVAVDVEQAAAELDGARASLATGDPGSARRQAKAAVTVAGREFLPGAAGVWVEQRRAELRRLRVAALEVLAQAETETGDWSAAVEAAEEAVALEPLRESAYVRLMAAHAAAGSRGEALRAYSRCRQVLVEELGVDPSEVTEAAYIALLGEEGGPALAGSHAGHHDRWALPVALSAVPAEVVVGRSQELARLEVAWKAACAGERRAVLVAGEPGVGKTRLVAAFARRAHDEGAFVLYGRCEEDLEVAYQPFAEALRGGFSDLDPEVVAAHLAAHGGEIRRLVPAVEAIEPVHAEPAVEQARLFDAVTDLLSRATENRPAVLVLDDLQWAAPSTIALLRHLLSADVSHSLCVVGTYRDTEVDRAHAISGLLGDIHRAQGVERLVLRGLDPDGIEELVKAGSGGALDDKVRNLAAALALRTDGNPLFANQLLRHLAERGVLVEQNGRWTILGSLDDVDLPDGVVDVVSRRLSRLSPAANHALAVAALGGLEFRLRVLCEVPDAGTPDAVVDGVDEAARARLLIETIPGRFAFIHAVVRDALISELTVAKRARLHRAHGQAILAVYGQAPELPLPELAYHYTEAAVLGDTATAARWATTAATAAGRQADHRGAIAVLERALAVIETVEPVDQTARSDVAAALAESHYASSEDNAVSVASAVDAARRLQSGARMLRIAMARYVQAYGVTDPEGIALYEEALQLLEPEAVPLRALATASLARLRSLQGIPGFTADVETAMDWLPAIDSSAPKAAAVVRGWVVHATLGLPGAAHRLLLSDAALAVPPDAEDPWWAQLASEISVAGFLHLHRGLALMALGRRTEFETSVAQVMELGATTGNPVILAMAHARVALLALLDGRFQDVAASANRMLETTPDGLRNLRLPYSGLLVAVAIEEGRAADLLPMMDTVLAISPDHPAMRARVGRILLEAGDRAGAAEALDQLLSGWTGWARNWSWPSTLAETAEIAARLERAEHAQVLADELGPYAGELAVWGSFCWGAFDRYRGMMLGLLGRHDEATTALTAALALEESVDSPPLTARTRYWLARALLQRNSSGDRKRAIDELNHSLNTAERLGMNGLARAARELAGVGTQRLT